MSLVVWGFLLLLSFVSCTTMDWVPLEDPQAVCNDGSPAGYYYNKGTNPNKWVIYLEGGGFCFDEGSCQLRWNSSPNLMSSKQYNSRMYGGGILSNNITENRFWYDASMAYVKYCSSDSFSGMNPNSDIGWKFMGSAIVESAIFSMIPRGLDRATQVLFTGTSAGAEGLLPNADRVAAMLGSKANLRVLLDSGWFLDFDPFRPQPCRDLGSCTEQGALMIGVPRWTPRLDDDCALAKTPNTMWECMLGYHAFPYMSTPSFVFQYTFDGAQLVCASVPFLNMKGHDGMGKPTTEAELKYAVESIRNLTTTFQATGVFSPACYRHGVLGLRRWSALTINGQSLDQVFNDWMNDPSVPHIYQDTCLTPDCNPTCSKL